MPLPEKAQANILADRRFRIAPLLMLGLGLLLISLTVGYWLKVGRLEVKGRPRSD